LREFSGDHEALLKEEMGSALESYFQRGNWRMVFPFSERHQEKLALRLAAALQGGRPAIVHVVRFPSLTINHAILLFAVEMRGPDLLFSAYDPNDPAMPTLLRYDSSARRFLLPETSYFAGGRVDVYEVYRGIWY
jgi:hypothetical protein